MAKKVTRRQPPQTNPLEDMLDDLQDRAMDWVGRTLNASVGDFKWRLRDLEHQQRVTGQQPPQGRRKAAQAGSRPSSVPQPPVRTAYTVLGVTPDAEPELLKAAYQAKARLYHPDTSKHPRAGEMMKELNAAWAILKDPVKRREYDRGMGL